MFNVNNVKVQSITTSESSLHPIQLRFTQNYKTQRTWDIIETHDTVRIILFNAIRNKLIILRRFEPSVYFLSIPHEDRKHEIDMIKYPSELGLVLELCGNVLNKTDEKSMMQEAKQTILQATGYNIPTDSLEYISSYKSEVGHKCGENHVLYTEINDEMKVASGGRIGEHEVEIVEMTISEMRKYIQKSLPEMRSTPCFLYTMIWFLNEKYKGC
ncbi:hypothetical protein HHI36_011408 [Cryptolaemus montrouzieri]|uniref:Nudix hydrolase domain-containing protein n=1 Tax=Cryptolaemus montrouzieri TaxID=559131 RepID=A0ABD2MLM0_9CUCU